MKIATKQGDGGRTSLYTGERVDKNDPRIEWLGDLDELVCLMGLARTHVENKELAGHLLRLQKKLFAAGSAVAGCEVGAAISLPEGLSTVELEVLLEALTAQAPEARGFVVPSATAGASHIDHARAVARRCERRLIGLMGTDEPDAQTLRGWFNRLSDVLWTMARIEEKNPLYLNEMET